MITKLMETFKDLSGFSSLHRLNSFLKIHPKKTAVVALMALAVVLGRSYHHNFIMYPHVGGRHNADNIPPFRHPSARGLSSEDLTLKTPDGVNLRGWYITQEKPENILVYLHENAGSKLMARQTLGVGSPTSKKY